MSKNKKVLFEESENEEEEEDGELHINKAYANKYQEWRLSEELQKYKDRFGDEDLTSSESSSDEDFAEADNPEFDREFLRAMGALQKKADPKLEGARFFTGDYSKRKEKEKEEKAMTVKDYERLIITDRGGELDEEEEGQGSMKEKIKPPKDKKLSGFEDGLSSDEDDSGDALLNSGLFKVKETAKPTEEMEAKSQADPLAFIRGESSAIKNEDRGLLEGLKEAWSDPKKSKDEKWLIDYFVNERYNEEEDDSKLRPYNGVVIDEEPISDDEKTLETMETFETKYRFRFEEPDEEFIKKYPRIITDSLRAKDESRKQKRIALKERKQKEKEVKRQEIERLKALKYKEIQAKIEKIKEASGNQDIDLGEKLFEEDFDEANHDQVMSDMFGEDYYAINDCDEEKPVFGDDDDIDVIQDYDQWLEKQDASQFGEEAGDWEEEEHWDDSAGDGYSERAEARKALEQEMIQASSKKKGRRRKSKFATAIKQKKPVFNPEEKTFESYFDEYYQLDFEDIISGVPCRFKYRKVEPNNFGLTTEEILSAQDRELNKWTSLKKMLRYHRDVKEELKDSKMYHHRASLPHVKQKILPSLFVEDPVNHHITEEEKKRLKNLKKKLRRQQKLQSNVEDLNTHSTVESEHGSYSQNESNTTQQINDKRPPKATKKRKRDTGHTSQDADEKINQAFAAETLKQPKKKKKKQLTGNDSFEDNQSVPLNSSGDKEINATEELQPNGNKNVEEKNNGVDTKNILHSSEVSETNNQNKKKKKKKANRQSALERTQIKKKKNTPALENSIFKGISDSRLAAYGENPKKIKNKVKYRKQNF